MRILLAATLGFVLVWFGYDRRDDVGLALSHWSEDRPAVVPATPDYAPSNEIAITAGTGGHFVLEAMVNGAPIRFLVDTGASNVVLDRKDAERAGLRASRLRFSQTFQTANGNVRGAPVTLRELRIGQFSLYDLDASVNEVSLGISLLGMAFLSRLDSYEVRGDRLILRW